MRLLPDRPASAGVRRRGADQRRRGLVRRRGAKREWEVNKLQPKALDDIIAKLHCPVFGAFGETDHIISLDDVRRFRNSLEKHKKSYDIHIYKGAPHGWLNDTMPGRYRKPQADAGWAAQQQFLTEVFGGGYRPRQRCVGSSSATARRTTITPRTSGWSSGRCLFGRCGRASMSLDVAASAVGSLSREGRVGVSAYGPSTGAEPEPTRSIRIRPSIRFDIVSSLLASRPRGPMRSPISTRARPSPDGRARARAAAMTRSLVRWRASSAGTCPAIRSCWCKQHGGRRRHCGRQLPLQRR